MARQSIDELDALREKCGLRQYRWAVLSGVNPSRLSQSLNGRLGLRADELSALESSLRKVIAERAATFNPYICRELTKAEQLQFVRKAADLTTEELASMCAVEPGLVTAAENGQPIPQHVFALLVGQAIYVSLFKQDAEQVPA